MGWQSASMECTAYSLQTDVCEEDEVKVHATGNIEEGEVSSGEEGEIKGSTVSQVSQALVHLPLPCLQMSLTSRSLPPSTGHPLHSRQHMRPHPLVDMAT